MEEQIKNTIYRKEDLKKSGGFKKKNNILEMDKKDFFIYLKENDLNIDPDYFDSTANISNGKKFRCSFNNIIAGTSQICKDFKNGCK